MSGRDGTQDAERHPAETPPAKKDPGPREPAPREPGPPPPKERVAKGGDDPARTAAAAAARIGDDELERTATDGRIETAAEPPASDADAADAAVRGR
ncbi:hypothetical protein [Arenimonas composti]|uniref:Uncharacterized protein n=1 Tax=Arenimonas composti TR7-09 = DSM 18010 TaxID=1121013 RepID=A0A091B933_9GAMM|nr:hypothetical protein [Arenimonas composti]KFN48261.1 hypothetical protein P873_01510 [Arenimonas composti TR7-09 = DSM 18010]